MLTVLPTLPLALMDGVIDMVLDTLPVHDRVWVDDAVSVWLADDVHEPVRLPLTLPLFVTLLVMVAVMVMLPLTDGVTDMVLVSDPVNDGVNDAVCDSVMLCDGVHEFDRLPLTLLLFVTVLVMVGVRLMVALMVVDTV